MPYLLLTSLVWAFSFGLYKRYLGGLDPDVAACLRLALAWPLFWPWLRWPRGGARVAAGLMALGAVQFGLMYAALNASYAHLQAWEVAFLTVLTPFYVMLWHGLRQGGSRGRGWLGAALAVAGAGVLTYRAEGGRAGVAGVLLVQLANLAFAVGQVEYRRWRATRPPLSEPAAFAWLYAGGCAVTALLAAALGDWRTLATLSAPGWMVLAYLGTVASGLCFFWWNRGAARTAPGPLAVMNNLKVPLAVLVALAVFGERADPLRLAAGAGLVLLGLAVAREAPPRATPPPSGRADPA